MKKLTSKSSLLYLYVVYFIAFQFLYSNWIVDVFGYTGYESNFNIAYFMVSCATISFLNFYAKNNSSPSSFFVHFILITIFIPSAVLFSGSGKGLNFIVITFAGIFTIILTLKFVRLKTLMVREFDIRYVGNFLAGISIIALLGIAFFSNFGNLNFDFSKVYEIRSEIQEDLPGVFGYINSAVVKIAIPFGLVFAIIQKRWGVGALFFVLSILFFGFTQQKAPIFTPILVTFLYYLSKSRHLKSYFLISAIAIVIISVIDLQWLNLTGDSSAGWFSSLFSRRALLVPSLLNYDYIDFFVGKEKYYWAASKISLGLIDSPYDVAPPQLIGYYYYGQTETSANAGWIGSGFANAGVSGVMFYSVCLGLIFSFLDAYAKKIGSRVTVALFITPIFAIISSTDLATAFITHGLLYGFLIVIFVRPDRRMHDDRLAV